MLAAADLLLRRLKLVVFPAQSALKCYQFTVSYHKYKILVIYQNPVFEICQSMKKR